MQKIDLYEIKHTKSSALLLVINETKALVVSLENDVSTFLYEGADLVLNCSKSTNLKSVRRFLSSLLQERGFEIIERKIGIDEASEEGSVINTLKETEQTSVINVRDEAKCQKLLAYFATALHQKIYKQYQPVSIRA